MLRLVLWWAVGMVGLRDFYAFMTDSRVKRMGSTAWVMLAMMLKEALVVGKFVRNLSNISPIPNAVVIAWSVAGISFAAFVVYQFTSVKQDVKRLFPPAPAVDSAEPRADAAAAAASPAAVPAPQMWAHSSPSSLNMRRRPSMSR